MDLEEKLVLREKERAKHRRHRKGDAKHPHNGKVAHLNRFTSGYIKNQKKGGLGATLKVKGEVRPSLWSANSHHEKGWETILGRKLSPNKAYALYART